MIVCLFVIPANAFLSHRRRLSQATLAQYYVESTETSHCLVAVGQDLFTWTLDIDTGIETNFPFVVTLSHVNYCDYHSLDPSELIVAKNNLKDLPMKIKSAIKV